jgi:hypothetical protein
LINFCYKYSFEPKMKSFVFLISFTLLLALVLAKKSSYKQLNDKKAIYFEDNQNERQIEKKLFYEKKHFDHLNGDDLHKMAKLSPIAVSKEDIELQADIDQKEDKSLRKSHHKLETDLHLQDLDQQNPNSKVEQISDNNEDKHRKHKHSLHKKHEVFPNHKHQHKNTKSQESHAKHFGSKDKFRTKDSLNYKHNKEQKHMKNRNKKHEKKSKQEFSKKYRKYNKYY